MEVRVLFFGVLKDLAGCSSEALTLPDEATAGDAVEHYARRLPSLKASLHSIAISVNQEYATPDHRLNPGDEVGLLPPVSGGSILPDAETSTNRVAITREKIKLERVLADIKHSEDGAVVVFDGVVRNHTRNRRTLFLQYEAYEQMALKQLHSLTQQAKAQFQIREVSIVHRLGRLEIGESSVLIVVASAHRAAAFDACR